ncbi:hypothetical protein KP509_1Z005900 [Ceratopteris richardii]|nr:hypothetical protein KP509_1Z005900 [Ceratopteris richardii]
MLARFGETTEGPTALLLTASQVTHLHDEWHRRSEGIQFEEGHCAAERRELRQLNKGGDWSFSTGIDNNKGRAYQRLFLSCPRSHLGVQATGRWAKKLMSSSCNVRGICSRPYWGEYGLE